MTKTITHEEEREPAKVDTGDSLKVKQAMDEAVVRAVMDMGFEEDHKWSNVKLLLMVVACAFAGLAQLYPKPFPESRPVLAVCCISYFACSALLQVVMSCIEQDVILITKPNAKGVALRIRTAFPRFQEIYTTELEVLAGAASQHATKLQLELMPLITSFLPISIGRKQPGDAAAKDGAVKMNVGNYFDVEGYFDEEGVVEDMAKAVASAVSAETKKRK
eukprot:TRINITY_DN216_c0_g1_i1.p1 TRINITY_DN216_c0_g1~~TRINITY_DN216_c0_g1_i1.p1  ORF type:complete len:219 (-),score=65.82 TRINITY_DN216_c0_g1_i1:317-973(-)